MGNIVASEPGPASTPAPVATPAKAPRAPRRMGYLSAKGFLINLLRAIEAGYELRIGDYGPDDTYIELWDMSAGEMVSTASAGDLDTLMAQALGWALEARGIIA